MKALVSFLFVPALCCGSTAGDTGRTALGNCMAALRDPAFPASAQAHVTQALRSLSLAMAAMEPAMAPLDATGAMALVLATRQSFDDVGRHRTRPLVFRLRSKMKPTVDRLEKKLGLEPHFGRDIVPAMLAYTVPVLNGAYGLEERQALLDALADVDRTSGHGAWSVNAPVPAEEWTRLRSAVLTHLGPNQITRFVHGTLRFMDRKLRNP